MSAEPKLGDIVTIRGSEQRAVVISYDTEKKLYEIFWVVNGVASALKIGVQALDVLVEEPKLDQEKHPLVLAELQRLSQAIAEVQSLSCDAAKVTQELATLKSDVSVAILHARAMGVHSSSDNIGDMMKSVVSLAQTWRREGNEQIERLKAQSTR